MISIFEWAGYAAANPRLTAYLSAYHAFARQRIDPRGQHWQHQIYSSRVITDWPLSSE